MPRALLLTLLLLTGCRTLSWFTSDPSDTEEKTAPTGHQVATDTSGLAQIHDSHCGGARITPEMSARMTRPAANTAFAVFPGDRNRAGEPAARFTTDADGRFPALKLAPGRYCVVFAHRVLTADQEAELLALPPPAPQPPRDPNKMYTDQDCLARLPLRCDTDWDTTRPHFRQEIWLPGRQCAWSKPCVVYNGPPPP